jgi:hypothetical protein
MFALSEMFFAQTGKTAVVPLGSLHNEAGHHAARRPGTTGVKL